jgi:hypothetical protein
MRQLAHLAAGAAVIGLTACSGSSAPSAGSATHAPISCEQLYHRWTQGEGKGVMDALHGVSSAVSTGDDQVLNAALRHAKPAVAQAARHPIPACADPRGYWDVVLMHVNAATAGHTSSASARAALRDVPKIHRQLLAEVKKAAS